VDRRPRQSDPVRAHRRRQELARLRPRPQGVPRQPLGALSAGPQAVRRSGADLRRRPLCSDPARPRRRPVADPR
jgi:hypothetical protein